MKWFNCLIYYFNVIFIAFKFVGLNLYSNCSSIVSGTIILSLFISFKFFHSGDIKYFTSFTVTNDKLNIGKSNNTGGSNNLCTSFLFILKPASVVSLHTLL